jgi:type I restriction enzyme S subunit
MIDMELPRQWRWMTLGELAAPNCKAIVSGPFGSNIGSRFFVETGIPVIRGKNLTVGLERFIDDGFVYVTEDKARSLGNCEAISNDLIFTAAGTIGQVGIIPTTAKHEKYIISNKQLRARLNQNIIRPLYAFYWLASPEVVQYIIQHNTGSTIPLINLSVLRSIPVPVPPLDEQSKIEEYLRSLDDKISLNRKLNKTLEAIARALFQSWFVDFDPLKAKLGAVRHGRDPEKAAMAAISGKLRIAPGKPRPEKLDEQLPTAEELDAAIAEVEGLTEEQRQKLAETATHFPDGFEESELGLIPERWEVNLLDAFAENIRDGIDPTKEAPDLPYVGLEHIEKKKFNLPAYGRAGDVESQKSKFSKTDFLFGKLRPYFHKVCFPQISGICSTDILVIRAKKLEYQGFVGSLIFNEEFVEFSNIRSTGTRMPRASWRDMASYEITTPGETLLKVFNQICNSHWTTCAKLNANSRTLAELRDTLLPKLLSGELSVGEATETLEAATEA